MIQSSSPSPPFLLLLFAQDDTCLQILSSLGNTSFSCKLKLWAYAQIASSSYCTNWKPSLTCEQCCSVGIFIFNTLLCLKKDNETLQGDWGDCCAFTANEIVTWLNYAKTPVCYEGSFKIRRLTELEQALLSCTAPVSNSLHSESCFLVFALLHVSLGFVRGVQQVLFSVEINFCTTA